MTSNAVKDLLTRFLKWRYSEFPEFATFMGYHKYDDKLQSYTLESVENRKKTVEEYLKEASQLLKKSGIKKEDQLDLTYFINDLHTFIRGQTAKGYFFPLSYLNGVHIEFESLLDAMEKETEEDYIKILKRISLLPRQVSEIIEIMREGIKNGMTFHLISVSGVLEQLDNLQKETEETIFFKPFEAIPDDVKFYRNSKDNLRTEAKSIIARNVLPAFKELKFFLQNEYFKHLRPEIGISSLSGVKKIYEMCLHHHIGCTMTPEEAHQTGLREVEVIKCKMQKIIESLELRMPIKDFSAHLKEQKDFSFQNVEDLLEAYRETVFNQIEPKLPHLFNYTPESELVIGISPSSTPDAPAARYGYRYETGTLWINGVDLDLSRKYIVMTSALHATFPGHHLQMSFTNEREDVPSFPQCIEQRRYSETPSLFPDHNAYFEGWAHYSEHLGYELGLYEDVYSEYGHLSQKLESACFLVVDTGIHSFGWTREKAIDYLLQYTVMDRNKIEKKIDKCITFPGLISGQKIGELKIRALREDAEYILGDFDIREFHDIVLQCYGSLQLLEERVWDYIKSYTCFDCCILQ